MGTNGTKARGSNALRRTLEMRAEIRTPASPPALFATLSDLQSHLEWGGKRASETGRMLTIDAPAGPATVGTEWDSSGSDPMGRFDDHSVVIEAAPDRVFEFVTEGRQTHKKSGEVVDWTIVHRYEIAKQDTGSRISYHARITSVSKLLGPMRLFNTPLVRLIVRMWAKTSQRSLENLAAVAQERRERM